MHQRTALTLAELDTSEWFINVGKRESNRVSLLHDWSEAIASCEGDDWLDLLQEAASQYRSRLAEGDVERFRQWNEHVRELKTVTIPLVNRKTRSVVEANRLPKHFVDVVQWDILHVCMEAEYADVFQPGFFASQSYWYLNGHFPCGWTGRFPNGKLVVY
ncbi:MULTISPECIES: hypothetical protein [Luteibacter]|uniref:hypothetical protein n=1 Tax=Luteibacter sp. dw_328 TaxID=2719796 RepID=UPI0007BF8FC4|nr:MULTISPECIES: hypothetical protein [Luteibacter]